MSTVLCPDCKSDKYKELGNNHRRCLDCLRCFRTDMGTVYKNPQEQYFIKPDLWWERDDTSLTTQESPDSEDTDDLEWFEDDDVAPNGNLLEAFKRYKDKVRQADEEADRKILEDFIKKGDSVDEDE